MKKQRLFGKKNLGLLVVVLLLGSPCIKASQNPNDLEDFLKDPFRHALNSVLWESPQPCEQPNFDAFIKFLEGAGTQNSPLNTQTRNQIAKMPGTRHNSHSNSNILTKVSMPVLSSDTNQKRVIPLHLPPVSRRNNPYENMQLHTTSNSNLLPSLPPLPTFSTNANSSVQQGIKCIYCRQVSASNNGDAVHRNSHQIKNHQGTCIYCLIRCPEKMLEVHGPGCRKDNPKPFKCNKCGKAYKSRSNRNEHQKAKH